MSFLSMVCLASYTGAFLCLQATPEAANAEDENTAGNGIYPLHLRTEYLYNPQGLDTRSPRLFWQVGAQKRAQVQRAYQILVASDYSLLVPGKADLWDSGKVISSETTHIVYEGASLSSGQFCCWTVRIWDAEDVPSAWAEPATWSMGLLTPDDWKAAWISYEDPREMKATPDALTLPPARYFRTEFTVKGPVRRAMLYATALGICDPHLNGQRVTEARFLPGWTDYEQRVYYHAFDVTQNLAEGANALGAILADGWFSGYLGYGLLVGYGPDRCGRYFYGKTPSLLMQLEVEYTDGSRDIVGTDPSWQVAPGAYLEADLLMGETYDATRTPEGWDAPGFSATGWESAVDADQNGSLKTTYHDAGGTREVDLGFKAPRHIEAYPMQPVLPVQTLDPVDIIQKEAGRFMVNFGQNFAGVVRLRAAGPAGTAITIRHGEMLHPDGRLMTENLRRARATDTWILRGAPDGEVYEPRFTFHGFQYAEISNYPGTLQKEDVSGIVLHNDTPLASDWESSDPMLNRFFQNVVWTQRANFLEVPTDCPQRDERFGWTGDAQVYARAAALNADVAAFFTKWMQDLRDAQTEEGAYPDYAPYPMQHGGSGKPYGTAWTDAGVIVPWEMYSAYGDTRLLHEHYDSVRRFITFRIQASPDFGGTELGNGWGDWLSMGEETPIIFIDHCYYAHSVALAENMAEVLGEKEDAATYQDLHDRVKKVFAERYIREDGTLAVDTQTAYVLALFMDLIPEDKIQAAAARLAEKIVGNDRRMTTGFLGTRPLLPVLTATGHFELAAELMQSRRFPSWGYAVEQGATTVWERWNSYTIEDGFQEGMNSFNHYAFGAVAEWMLGVLGGIQPAEPGYRTLRIHPHVPLKAPVQQVPPLTHVRASHECLHGLIQSAWRRDGETLTLDVTVPPNTSAWVHVPGTAVHLEGAPIAASPLVEVIAQQPLETVLKVPSGKYSFTSTLSGVH